ncbi:MAG TPA: hypothetical protein VH183_04160 [Burkholderiaceae bacterium]|jgi:hypothetical protein|nr:hypothetical protein [Burkholderiaceae bacterium]
MRWIVFAAFGAAAAAALADDNPCAGFTWDVSRERALFATAAEPVPGGKNDASAPLLAPDQLYELALAPQEQVAFAAPPGRKKGVEGASGGLARLHLTAAGDYRIALDQAFWIDVVANHQIVASKDFQGRPGCQAPHKIVLYSLPAEKDLILQFSGATAERLKLTITPVAKTANDAR